uniref:Immune-type receptor 12 n=1 Tax=Sphoeroides nephelus TaxID=39110 RepID=Q9IB00_9TELE|nr:immune-type receptor 12 [Sphoeroides nephelus]
MESLQLAFYVSYFCLSGSAETPSFLHPSKASVFANVGDTITLECSSQDDTSDKFHWYKQTLGDKPRLISSFYKHDKNVAYIKEFNNSRFSVNIKGGKYHLTIAQLRVSDSATYFCASGYMYAIGFEKIYMVQVLSFHLSVPVEVHQSPSESIQSGGSVTLNCTVQTGSCDEEHTVYWFKNSGESGAQLIYTHGSRKEQCERKSNICVYNLSMKNLNISKVGSYYCAVAACGRILFGAGTNVDTENGVCFTGLPVYALTGALVVITILCVLLALSLMKLRKKSNCQKTQIDSSFDMTEMVQEHNVHYAALRDPKVNKSRRKRESKETECVYTYVSDASVEVKF